MTARALPLRKVLVVVVAACLAVQLGITAAFFPQVLPAAVVVVCLCGAAAWLLLRWAFGGLSAAARRLSEMAQAEDWQRSLRAPALIASPAYRELESLRQRVLERVEQSQQLRAQAEEAARYKAAFLRSVRHELRTPLNSILGFADVLLADLEGPLTADQRENLQMIRSEGQRLSDLFDEVIALATIAAGQLELERGEVDVPSLFERVASKHERTLAARMVHLRQDVGPGVACVFGDAERLFQVLSSLLGYALRVTPGNALALRARWDDDNACIELVDGARVLSADELQQLLRGASPGKRRVGLDEGARLRLSICRQIVELHGGRFCVDSGSDAGTSFVLTLPRSGDG